MDGDQIIEKIKRGGIMSNDDKNIMNIYSSLYSKNAGNAGKRKIIKTGK